MHITTSKYRKKKREYCLVAEKKTDRNFQPWQKRTIFAVQNLKTLFEVYKN
jgi:hypothetical protein